MIRIHVQGLYWHNVKVYPLRQDHIKIGTKGVNTIHYQPRLWDRLERPLYLSTRH